MQGMLLAGRFFAAAQEPFRNGTERKLPCLSVQRDKACFLCLTKRAPFLKTIAISLIFTYKTAHQKYCTLIHYNVL